LSKFSINKLEENKKNPIRGAKEQKAAGSGDKKQIQTNI
jgi:hypothetical protein